MNQIKQGYKQTKVGIIPQDWEVVKLGEISKNGIMNGVFNDPKKVGKGLKLINVVNLYNEPFINYDDLKLLEVSEKEYKKFSALKGDLFFTRSSLKEEGIAHCNLLNIDTNDTVFECHTMRIRPKKEVVNSYFILRYCQSSYARKILISNSKTTTMTTIDQNGLFSLLVPLPPLKEQEKIAEILTTWDEAITKQEEFIALKEQLKKGLMQKLLSGEVRFGGFVDEWEAVRLGEIAEIYQPQTISQIELTNEGFDVYGANGIIGKYHQYNHELEQIAVTCRGNTCGTVNFTKPKSWITGNAMVINLDNSTKAIKTFIYYLFLNTNFTYLVSGSGQPQITGNIKNHKLKLPPLPEQQKIAEVLSLSDHEINLLKNELDELKQQKKALMQKLLTGEVRVNV